MAEIHYIKNYAAEKSVLTCCLLGDRSIAYQALVSLDVSDFYKASHQKIFAAIAQLFNSHKSTDAISVAHILKAKGELEEAGGYVYLAELTDSTFDLLLFETHLEIVKELSLERHICESCYSLALDACEPKANFDVYLSGVRSQLKQLLNDLSSCC